MIRLFILFILTSSCALLKTEKLSDDLYQASDKICLSAIGKGRLIIGAKKYLFSYESSLNKDLSQWVMSFYFPLYGEELVRLDWSEQELNYLFSFENKILKQQKGVSPEKLELFIKLWAKFLYEVVELKEKKSQQQQFQWKILDNEIMASKIIDDKKVLITFQNLVASRYFGRYDIALSHKNKPSDFKIEIIVRKCLE